MFSLFFSVNFRYIGGAVEKANIGMGSVRYVFAESVRGVADSGGRPGTSEGEGGLQNLGTGRRAGAGGAVA